MKVNSIDRKDLNIIITNTNHCQFLQSWQWGEFQESVGNKVLRLGFYNDDELVWAVSLIKKLLPLGKSYLYAPRINLDQINKDDVKEIFHEVRKIAKQEGAIFLRIEPTNRSAISDLRSAAKHTIDVQPSKTLIIDLTQDEEEILKQMHQKTRYNIRLARKKEVQVQEGEEKDFHKFWQIMEETKERDQFRLHSREYYLKMLSIDFVKLIIAKYQGQVIAGVIVSFFSDTATYIHGASANKFRNVMAPYALQWQAIQMAKNQECKFYDLNGIDDNKWPGVTRFKKGFKGKEFDYPGTFDLIFDKVWYNIYMVARKIRRM